MKRCRIAVVAILCFLVAFGVSCRPGNSSSNSKLPGQTVAVVRGDLTVSVSGNGTITSNSNINLAFDKGGKVSRIYVAEGDKVSSTQALALLIPLDEEQLKLAVSQAEAALAQAEYNLNKAENPYTEKEFRDARKAVNDAEDSLDLTDEMLRYAIKSGDQQQILQWQMNDLQAQDQLDLANEKLDNMLNERDEDQIAVLKKQLATAEQALGQAQDALQTETLLSPIPGVVAHIYLDEGNVVPQPRISQVTVMQLIDAANMQLVVSLDEIDTPGVASGDRAIIKVDAIPESQFEGRVISIAPLPAVEAGVVSYDVKVSFIPPQNLGVRIGMSATADIITNERKGVLLVPDGAVSMDSQGNPMVKVVTGDTEKTRKIEERAVAIGISDGFQTEVISGLREGEMVLLEAPTGPSQPAGGGLFGPGR